MKLRTILSRKKLLAVAVLTAAVPSLSVAACGGDDDGDEGSVAAEPAATVVASTNHVADIAQNVAGERAEVIDLLAPGTDPHDHEPRPSDAQAVSEADLIVQSGGHLDIWVDDLVTSSGTDAPAIELIDSVETIAGGHGHADEEDDDHDHGDDHGHAHADDDGHDQDHADDDEVDPHWWQDPTNAVLAAREIRDRLTDVDPEGRDEYRANARAYVAELEALDAAIADCMGSIPAGERKLVTSHDAFGYFAGRYDIEVVGAAIPALTTQAQPSAGETAELIELINAEGVPAVFPEAGLSDRLEQALANETEAEIGGELWGDTLGEEGSGAATYVEAMAANASTLASGLSRGEQSCPGL